MQVVRELVQNGHAVRKSNGWGVKDPKKEIAITSDTSFDNLKDQKELLKLVLDELNTYAVKVNDIYIVKHSQYDEVTDDYLKAQGEARRIVRLIQEERKKLGTTMNEKVNVQVETYPKEFEGYIKKQALIETLTVGDSFLITRLT